VGENIPKKKVNLELGEILWVLVNHVITATHFYKVDLQAQKNQNSKVNRIGKEKPFVGSEPSFDKIQTSGVNQKSAVSNEHE